MAAYAPWHMALSAGCGGAAALGAVALGAPWALALCASACAVWIFVAAWPSPTVSTPPPHSKAPDAEIYPTGFGRALLYQLPAPLLVIAETERITYANPAAQAVLPRVSPGAHYSDMIRAPAFVEAIERILTDRQDVACTFSLMMERERFFEARASMLPAGAGDFGDADQIIVQIEDRTRDEILLKARTDFVANASHELRTPLASILGYIETLQGHARDDPEARELFLGIMMQQATRMQRLVDDLMSLSRIEMDAHIRPDQKLELHQVASEAAHALFPVATQNDVMLQIEIGGARRGPEVIGDRDQLAQVVVNLVDNAIRYGGSGTKIRIAAAEPNPKYPGHVGVSVIDDGPGIARENLHRLTERFFRVSSTAGRERDGTGLGLAITKHILNRHSGLLAVESTPGKGSTFTFWLPQPETAPGLMAANS
ncbi:MAG: ATP-binding protein [Pseudomonadota bacterium]